MKKRSGLKKKFLAVSIIPILLLGIGVTILSSRVFNATMDRQIQRELAEIAESYSMALDLAYPGEYMMIGSNSMVLVKGHTPLNDNFDYIDSLKENCGVDVSLFYTDIRFLTTITDSDGNRILGTNCNEKIVREVINTGEARFYDDAIISGGVYYVYYMPLFKGDECVGMIGVAKTTEDVNRAVDRALIPMIILAVVMTVIAAIVITGYAGRLVSDLTKLNKYMGEVAKGNFKAKLDYSLTKRNDEVEEMSQSAVRMKHDLRKLVELDPLTGLENRRSASNYMRELIDGYNNNGEKFVMVLGDIDYFKKVNDTYGHDAGDEVLKMVAGELKSGIKGKGFCSRWGGEEFLMGLSGYTIDSACELVEEILDKIRENTVETGEHKIKVTMSFGIAEGNGKMSQDALVKAADDRLYYAKEHGRNRICVSLEENQ